ncbi:MAG: carboxypeptidase-like regulatory domain-containing protein [Candidatus Margulisiibacteriota bacterium]
MGSFLKAILIVLVCGFSLIAINFLGGCGDSVQISSITVSPSSVTVGLSKTQQFTATAYDSSGRSFTTSVEWTVTGSIGSIDTSGLFTAGSSMASGTVVASASGVSGSATVSVTNEGSVSGTISSSAGEHVASISITITRSGTTSGFSSTTVSDTSGRYVFPSVPVGDYDVVTAATMHYLGSSAEVSVSVGETTTQNITLSDRFTVSSQSFIGTPITISGTITNNGTGEATGVTAVYMFYDLDGLFEGSATANLGSISGLASKSFVVIPTPSVYSYSSYTRTISATGY